MGDYDYDRFWRDKLAAGIKKDHLTPSIVMRDGDRIIITQGYEYSGKVRTIIYPLLDTKIRHCLMSMGWKPPPNVQESARWGDLIFHIRNVIRVEQDLNALIVGRRVTPQEITTARRTLKQAQDGLLDALDIFPQDKKKRKRRARLTPCELEDLARRLDAEPAPTPPEQHG